MLCTLQNMRQYLTGLTANLAKHTITDVQHEDRVSLLLKDSFIESFAPKERPFVRQFVVNYCDAVANNVQSVLSITLCIGPCHPVVTSLPHRRAGDADVHRVCGALSWLVCALWLGAASPPMPAQCTHQRA